MRLFSKVWAVVLLGIVLGQPLCAQTVRLLNGVAVQGEVIAITDGGLQVRTVTGIRTFTWDSLAPNTRFRYQPLYRANYDAVLRGIPRARWVNAPDPIVEEEVRSLVQATSAPSVKQASTSQLPVAQPPPSLLIFDHLNFDHVQPLQAASFPGATFRNFDHASFIGFQYGVAASDVVYFAFDTAGPSDPSDVLFVYSPGMAEFTNTVKIKGFKKGTGADRRITYRKLRMTTLFGKTQIVIEMEPETTGLQTNDLFLTINVDLSRDKERSRFTLFRQFADLLHGDGSIPVKSVVDIPNLWLGCQASPGSARATLMLSMANMVFVPRDGMDTRVALTVMDSSSNVVYRDNVKMDLFPPPLEGVTTDLRRVAAGQTYTVTATMNLGPFLGLVKANETLTVPAN